MQSSRAIEGPMGITVTGIGTAQLEAEFAEVSFAVTRTEGEASQAYAAALGVDAKVVEVLKSADVPEHNLKIEPVILETTGGDGSPSYRARRNYRVWLPRPDRIDAVLEQLVAAGVNVIERVKLGSHGHPRALAEARVKAIEHAREQAEAHASTVGAEIGRVLLLEDQPITSEPEQALPAPTNAGRIIVRALVKIGFSLERRGSKSGFG
jgi:uncharacterized protein